MFFKLILKNSKRSRKENGLFFSSLVISIVAFYIILSLSSQDVMIFLKKMESDAVDRLLTLIPSFYGLTLIILFFLIYYASKFQLERRRHEFGVYLLMGMRRPKLFGMLLAEDIGSSLIALITGLPIALLLSELISLITAKCVGLGVIGHQISFSLRAMVLTAVGFLIIKFLAFLILSGKIARQEIGFLLVEMPEGTKKQHPTVVYGICLAGGIVLLFLAYALAISGTSWQAVAGMGITILLGLIGMLLFFYGLRFLIGLIVKRSRGDKELQVFNFRQIEECVMNRSSTLSISSVLILAALCCFGAGISIASFYGKSEQHILDYTFQSYDENQEDGIQKIEDMLAEAGLLSKFSNLFEVKIGNIATAEDYYTAFQMTSVVEQLKMLEESEDKNILLNNLGEETYPHLISLSGYNKILAQAGLPELVLAENEAAVYRDSEFTNEKRNEMLNNILKDRPEVSIDGSPFYLTGSVYTKNLVADRSITLSFALIVPDEVFNRYTAGCYDIYLNGVLDSTQTKNGSLLSAIMEMNDALEQVNFASANVEYESYLKSMGRKMFYIVAASYITIYLAIIFMIIANTIIGVQFLMGQQKSGRRYRTLIRLGATYELLCRSSNKQINWYFGMPVAVAAVSSIFGTRALFTGLLPGGLTDSFAGLLLVAAAMILLLCMIEYIYMTVVKRSSSKYLLTLMVPERDE